jgi:hypothetical protein
LLDEIAYWPTDEMSSAPDIEVVNAVRPTMSTTPGAMLLCASSPHSRRGALWTAYDKHYGKDGDPILVWQAETRSMNASVPQSYIDQHVAEDPTRASAEYGAQFRGDLECFVSLEAVRSCVHPGVYERAPQPGVGYHCFTDPSGGSSDSFTLAIGHRNFAAQTVVIDCLREVRPPFSPEVVCGEFAKLIKSYHCIKVISDRFANIWPREQFGKFGVIAEQSAEPKSLLYGGLLPLINSRRIELLDHSRAINQIASLERSTARGGRDSIDHAPGAHDDLANCVAGVAAVITSKYGSYNLDAFALDDPSNDDVERRNARYRQGLRQHIYNTLGVWPT